MKPMPSPSVKHGEQALARFRTCGARAADMTWRQVRNPPGAENCCGRKYIGDPGAPQRSIAALGLGRQGKASSHGLDGGARRIGAKPLFLQCNIGLCAAGKVSYPLARILIG